MPCEQAAEIYRFCSEHRVTLDELVDQFLRWCIREPKAFMEWYEKCEKEEPSPMNRTPGMSEITQDELIAHIEDKTSCAYTAIPCGFAPTTERTTACS